MEVFPSCWWSLSEQCVSVCVAWNKCTYMSVSLDHVYTWRTCIELQIIYLPFTLITWNRDHSLALKCLAKYRTALGKCKCVLGVCLRGWVLFMSVCVCVQAKVNVYWLHVWLCWRRRGGQSRDTVLLQGGSRACPAQIITVGPGRVILGTYVGNHVILAADTVLWKNIISGRVAVFLKCTDVVNSGKSYYLLLMSVIKSKPITKEWDVDKERQTSWKKDFKHWENRVVGCATEISILVWAFCVS